VLSGSEPVSGVLATSFAAGVVGLVAAEPVNENETAAVDV
jgi:hypothetical protein